MRSSMALAGSAAVLALVLTGCASDNVSGAPVTGTTTEAAGGPSPDVSRPAIDPNTTEPASGLKAVAGDWRQDTKGTPVEAHADVDGSVTLTQRGRTAKGQLVWLGDTHYRILLTAASGVEPPRVTADVSADGRMMTVHSSDEPNPIVYKRVG